MAEAAQTGQTGVDPRDFIAGVPDDRRRRDALALLDLFAQATGYPPRMWGPTMIGYGRYAYRYESGHSGESFLTGFSPRKANMVVYVPAGFEERDDLLARLGKHKRSVSCLYLGTLDRIDLAVLREIVVDCAARMKARHEHWPQ